MRDVCVCVDMRESESIQEREGEGGNLFWSKVWIAVIRHGLAQLWADGPLQMTEAFPLIQTNEIFGFP